MTIEVTIILIFIGMGLLIAFLRYEFRPGQFGCDNCGGSDANHKIDHTSLCKKCYDILKK